MPETTYSISEIREQIMRLPERFEEDPEAVTVTRHGKAVMTILPTESYRTLIELVETLQETLEILQDDELMAAFRRGVKDMEEGRVKPLDDVLRELGWE
ncbi:MAG TPA: type II toxin-antitoxin system Phd/YefM family antitoxin [Ktedonobacteraceae bacterium]|jgi:PHD/YefM family antitoxin component YafN of YafNO toxin-antitoxin module|nr:type II toxin-antitoxin system Phd/YefM family antitoxin [Ktedonobacteraceae bacterium]